MTIFTRMTRKALRRKQHPTNPLWVACLLILLAHIIFLLAFLILYPTH